MSLLALVILHPLLHILDVLMILFESLVVSISHLLYLLISSLLSPQVVLLSLHLLLFRQKLLALKRLLLPFCVLHHHLMQAINILLRLTFNVLLDPQQSLNVTLFLISSRVEKAICCLVVIDAARLLLRSVIIVD